MSGEGDSKIEAGETSDGAALEENSSISSAARTENISKYLHNDISGADCLVSLFWAAMNSFRHDSILRPFPSDYVEGPRVERVEGGREAEGEKDIEGLVCGYCAIYFIVGCTFKLFLSDRYLIHFHLFKK